MTEIAVPDFLRERFPELGGDTFVGVASLDNHKDCVYWLRYVSYRSREYIETDETMLFSDEYDLAPENFSIYLRQGGQIVASIRHCYSTPQRHAKIIPAYSVYPSETADIQHKVVSEGNRFVVYPGLERHRRAYTTVLLRYQMASASYLGSEIALAAVREQHVPFYRRYLMMFPISKPKYYPGLRFSTILLCASMTPTYAHVCSRYPIFHVPHTESDMLFSGVRAEIRRHHNEPDHNQVAKAES